MKRLSILVLGFCLVFAVNALASSVSPISVGDGDARRAYLEKALESADVYDGCSVEDVLNPAPPDASLMSPQFFPWVEVWDFPINESVYAVGVGYLKDAGGPNNDENYVVTTGISPAPYFRFYNSSGNQVRSCAQPFSSGWGMRGVAMDQDSEEIYGGGATYYYTQIVGWNCRQECRLYLTLSYYQYGTALDFTTTGKDTMWGKYWYYGYSAYPFDAGNCNWSGGATPYEIPDRGRGVTYGIALDQTGSFGEDWVMWASMQNGPGGTRMEAIDRNGYAIGSFDFANLAGGVDFTDDWEGTGFPAIIHLEQGSPDRVVVYQPPPPNDVAVISVSAGGNGFLYGPGDDLAIGATVGNLGTDPQGSFDVIAIIMEGATELYNETVTVSSLASGATVDLTFPDFTIPASEIPYDLEVCTDLAGDEKPSNDCMSSVIVAVEDCDIYRQDDDATITNATIWSNGDYAWGLKYQPLLYPATVKWVYAKVCSPGGPFWPWPTSTLDPFQLSVYTSSDGTTWPPTPDFEATVVDDGLDPFGDVYAIVAPPIVVTEGFVMAALRGGNYPSEGTGLYMDDFWDEGVGSRYYRSSTGFWYLYNTTSYGDFYLRLCMETPPPIEWVDDELEADADCDVVGGGGEVAFDTDIRCNVNVSDVSFRSTSLVNGSGGKIPGASVSFDPAAIAAMASGDVATISVAVSIAAGQSAGDYEGELIVEAIGPVGLSTDELPITIHVEECCDLDVDDDYANVDANKMVLVAAKSKKNIISVTMGEFVVLNPNDKFTNVDMDDGPGNVGFSFTSSCEDLYCYHHPDSDEIPGGNVTFAPDPGALGSGKAIRAVLTVTIPDTKMHEAKHGEDHHTYRGRVTVTSDCDDVDEFTLNVNIVKSKPGTVLPNTFVGDLDERGLLLAWGEFSFGESFNLYREDDSGEYVLLNSNPMSGNSNYLDENIVEGGTYAYKFGVIDETGQEMVFGPMTAAITRRPTSVSLMPGVPNPMNTEATIRYTITNEAEVSLKVYDVTGSLVRTLVNESVGAGYHSVLWNGTNDAGNKVANGVYFYRLTAGDFNQSRKLVVLR